MLAAISKRQFKRSDELDFNLLDPADKILQQRSGSLVAGYDVIKSTITEIGKLRNDAEFEKMLQKLPVQLSHPPNKLIKSVSSQFREGVIHNRTHGNSQ